MLRLNIEERAILKDILEDKLHTLKSDISAVELSDWPVDGHQYKMTMGMLHEDVNFVEGLLEKLDARNM